MVCINANLCNETVEFLACEMHGAIYKYWLGSARLGDRSYEVAKLKIHNRATYNSVYLETTKTKINVVLISLQLLVQNLLT